jgi:hypothetical protein
MKYYSIHDLFTVATNTDVPIPEYFAVDKLKAAPDMEVIQKPLSFHKPEKEMLMRTNYYFWKDDNTLYIDYATVGAKIAIKDIFGKPKIECTRSFRRLTSQESWNSIVHAVMWFNLIKRGYTFIHAGCLSYKNKEGVIITAPADTGKTSTIMTLLSTNKFGFMTDDAVLIGNGYVHAYPQEVKISPYTLTGGMNVKRSLKRKIFKSRRLGLASERLFRMKITDMHKIPDELVVRRCPAKKVFILTGYNKKPTIKKIDERLAARILLLPSAELSTMMHRYIELYYFMFSKDTFNILERMNEIIEGSFKNTDCYVLQSPKLEGYSQTILKTLE